ncbi:MAG TPA: porin family protein [Puia sp.]|nr:porin family protein [Puia sp.]
MQPHVPVTQRLIGVLLILLPITLSAQQPGQPDQPTQPAPKKEHHSIGIGIKAGLNFANVTNASAINSSTRAGYHAGVFYSTDPKRILGSHTELLYSRHGFNYKNDSVNGSVNLDYLMFTQMMAINITKYFQIQLGGTTSYLLNVKTDSSQYSTGNASADKLLSYYNRFDYGFAVGVEIHPIAGLLIGARYCLSFANLYKTSSFTSGGMPSITPNVNFKNNVVQLSLGYRF